MIRAIQEKIFDICYKVDKDITGWPEDEAFRFATANSRRHAHTIRAIETHVARTGKRHLKILNASGISCGHGDFSIAWYLKNVAKLNVEWVAYESPNNNYLRKDVFREFLTLLDIQLNLSDFSNTSELYGTEVGVYDVIIFTEVAEHLDYSVFLKALTAIRKRLKEDGILILTTPNLLDWRNRLNFLLGNGDYYAGDGVKNMQYGVYQHILLYDIRRLRRITGDIGFKIVDSYTFNHWASSLRSRPVRFLLLKALDLALLLFRNAKFTLIAVCEKCDPVEIPLLV